MRGVREVGTERREIGDEKVEGGLWAFSERMIEALEREGAVRRAVEKKEIGAMDKGERDTAAKEHSVSPNTTGIKAAGSRRSRKMG